MHKLLFLICFQVNSEEHDNAEGEATIWTRNIPKEILEKVSEGKEVSADRITVWVDPLDATQEYTGLDLCPKNELLGLSFLCGTLKKIF